MDMKKILQGFEDASNGKKVASATADANSMKQILESFDGATAEGVPSMAPAPYTPPAPEDKGNPVSVSVNINATGKDHVQDLMDLMRNAGLSPKAVEPMDMPPMDMPPMDMPPMDKPKDMGIIKLGPELDLPKDMDMDKPDDMDDLKPGLQKKKCPICGKVHLGNSGCGESTEEDYDNSPDETYQDTEYMTRDITGGLNKEKKAYKAAQPGDNAMAAESIKSMLMKALAEKMGK